MSLEYDALIIGLIGGVLSILAYAFDCAKSVGKWFKRRGERQPGPSALIGEQTACEIALRQLRSEMDSSGTVIVSASKEGETWRIIGHKPYTTIRGTETRKFEVHVNARTGTPSATIYHSH